MNSPAGSAEVREERTRYAGVGTRLLRTGGEESPPVLLLHGFSDSADTWRGLMAELARLGRPAVAVDLPGFGAADRVPAGPSLPRIDAFVGELLRDPRWGGEPLLLGGNSLGGVASLRAAHDADAPLAGIVPIGPAGLGHQPWVDFFERLPLVQGMLTRVAVPPAVVRLIAGALFARLVVGDRAAVDPEVARRYASHIDGSDWVRRTIGSARPLLEELRAGYELERIRCPVMLVWGTRDRFVPVAGAERLRAELPDARVELLEGAGHCPQHEAAPQIAALIEDFGASIERWRAGTWTSGAGVSRAERMQTDAQAK
jgi:pimeloyl-ACP methyl ester carboxylesterase